jgi:Mg-chelatase subunit ChlD
MHSFHFATIVLIAALIAMAFSACDSPLDVSTPRNRYVDRVSTPQAELIGGAVSIVLPPDTSDIDTTVRVAQFSVALVVDASGSISSAMAQAFRNGCHAMLDSLDGVKDEGVVIFYTETATISQSLNTQVPLLRAAVDAIPNDGASATAMWDGIYMAMLELQSKGSHAHKALVLISDGDDNSSTTGTPAKITALGQSAGIQVYTIAFGLTNHEIVLRNIVQSTGGIHYPQPELSMIDDICREIAHKLRTP